MTPHNASSLPNTPADQDQDQNISFDNLTLTNYDAIQYLNDTLPALTLSSQSSSVPKQNRSALLQNASVETQQFLSQLNTHNVRSSSELTNVTDEILRGANRLAYEVEVLRGDANNLYEVLTDNLRADISQFVLHITGQNSSAAAPHLYESGPGGSDEAVLDTGELAQTEPDFIRQLRVLGLIKSRLETVITIFGEATKWPIASSEVTGTSSLISVSAPELGVVTSAEDDQAREYAKQLRNEIIELLNSDGGGQAGLEAAIKKVNDLKRLIQVWKDTSEEKARIRMVEGLSKTVEERKKLLDSRSASIRTSTEGSVTRSSSMPGRAGRIVEGSTNTAAGLFRKLRDEIYLE